MSVSAKLIEEATNKPDLLAAAHALCTLAVEGRITKNMTFTFSDGSKLISCNVSTMAWTVGGVGRFYPDYVAL